MPSGPRFKMPRGPLIQPQEVSHLVASDMNSNTVGGLVAYCNWLLDKHYATLAQIKPWRIAIQKVFGAVADGDDYESISLDSVDLEDVFRRFRTYGVQTYKSESMDAYISRVRRALDAYRYWQENGRPPVFRQVGKKGAGDDAAKQTGTPKQQSPAKERRFTLASKPDQYEFSYPLATGMAHISVPLPMTRRDIERLTTVLSTLEEQPQIPERTGEQNAA